MARKAKKLQDVKVQAVASAKSTLQDYSDFIFADYRGLTVEQMTNLRNQLRSKNTAFKVLKNNFARLAFEELKVESVSDFIRGPTAVVLPKGEPNEIAKILYDFAKEAPALQVKGGVISSELYDAAKLEAFSKLPGKKQLIAMMMSAINGPVQKLAATLQAYVDKKFAGEGQAPAPAAEVPVDTSQAS
jgi:large subunit ribosomal protein L10